MRATGRAFVGDLSAHARESKKSKRACPICHNRTAFVAAKAGPRTLALDVCTCCHFVWFDPTEYAATPRPALEEPTTEAGRLLARWEAQLRSGTPAESEIADKYVDKWWKWVPPVLGMPAERETAPLLLQPWVTWAVAAVITMVTFVAFFDLELAITRFGLIPAHFWRYAGLTFLTSFFLHGGLLHLLGNLYFLMVFGDNVEDFLGRSRYLWLVLLAALAGDALHIVIDPFSTMPSVGASGGISGVVAFYGLQFPRARLLILLRFLFFYPLRITARTGLLLWILLQLVGVFFQLGGFTQVNHLAHLGGAAVGVAFWLRLRNE
jgi:membrane associated rhomboid family serine protease